MTDDHTANIAARAVWFLRVKERMSYPQIQELTDLSYEEISDLIWLGEHINIADRVRVKNCGRELIE